MEQNHQQRRAAAKDFLESLGELEGMLQPAGEEETPKTDSAKINENDAELLEGMADIDLEAFEDAVADIEQYMQNKSKKNS